jgi:uncharacterized protein YpmS
MDEHETSLVAVVDSNTARLFVLRTGVPYEVDGPDDDSVHYRKRSMGGWSQARYQRHIDKHRADFASEVASELDRLVTEEHPVRIVLAGDEIAMTALTAALSSQVAALVEGKPMRIHIRAPGEAVGKEVRPRPRRG